MAFRTVLFPLMGSKQPRTSVSFLLQLGVHRSFHAPSHPPKLPAALAEVLWRL